MFTATKIQIMKETQECVSKVYSAVRTRLGSLACRVSNLETELRCKAQVVEILEARIAELEKRSSVQPDHTGDSAGQEEPGAPARANHLPAMEVEEHVVARSEDYGEATPPEVSGGQDDAKMTPSIASREAVISMPSEVSGCQDNATTTPAIVSQQAVISTPSEVSGGQGNARTTPSIASQEVVIENYDSKVASGGQDNARTTPSIASQEAVIENYDSKVASAEPLTMEDLTVLQVRLSKRLAKLAESPSVAESPPVSTPMPQSALSSTPTRVIRKVIQMRRVIEDEIKNTEAEILDLSRK